MRTLRPTTGAAWRRATRRRLPLALALLALLGAAAPPSGAQSPGTTIVLPTPIPLSAPEIVNPMRGYYRWYGGEPIPQPRPAEDHYARYNWREIEPARGQYDFSAIEQALQSARAAGARFSFRVMSVNEFSGPVEVPDYLMGEAGGAFCSYGGAPLWVPYWDSPAFLARARALMAALGASFDGDPRLGYYDIGIYGHWGEWHNGGLCTSPASSTTKRALVDMQLDAFPRTRVLMNSGGAEVDAFLYALGRSPRVGIRVDSLCDPWFAGQFNASPEKLAAAQERWKTAPLVTEFYRWDPPDIALCDQQVRDWHIAAIANGNLRWQDYGASGQAALLLMGKHSGYRFVLDHLTYPAAVTSSAVLTITSSWENLGVTPAYEPLAVVYELRPLGQSEVTWSGLSQLDLDRFLPTSAPQEVSDPFFLPSRVPPGTYTLSLVVLDPTGYRAPLALAIQGADGAGRYPLGTISVSAGPPGYEIFLPIG